MAQKTQRNEVVIKIPRKEKTASLRIEKLTVQREKKELLKTVSFTFQAGKTYVLMGPNGAGKSTLLYTILGHPSCTILHGKVTLEGKDITKLGTHERSKLGLFLSFQNPVEVPGVRLSHFLRTIVNAQRESRKEKALGVPEFAALLKEKLLLLGLDEGFAKRYLNEGFSGGEKKRAEILQLALLEPRFAFLDETDSGLDVDGMKTVAQTLHQLQQKTGMAIIIVTHYKRFVDYLSPDTVYVLQDSKTVYEGGKELITAIDTKGFAGMRKDKK